VSGPLDLFHEFVEDTDTAAAAATITASSMTTTTTNYHHYYHNHHHSNQFLLLFKFTVARNSARHFSEMLVFEFLLDIVETLLRVELVEALCYKPQGRGFESR
jgi:hypothetical protein